jgi:hypothetical protein
LKVARGLFAALSALLLALQVVRSSAVAALVDRSPDAAARIWPAHPAAQAALGMTEIGRAAGHGQALPASIFSMMDEVAVKAPLAPEPFLVRGVQAQLAGNRALALQAFTAAERRDPRALPAHYFLADTLFRTGASQRGLDEIAVLARLSPFGVGSVAPYVAAYAHDRSTWPQLRVLFRSNPDLEETTLAALARDPRNADTVMALSDEKRRSPKLSWVSGLLYGLVNAGEYAKARAMWAAISHVQPAPGRELYDAGFADASSPPPFNWELTSSSVGVAEPEAGGQLHVIFYGREDGLLAKQLMVLAPGRYRVSMAAAGELGNARALTWSVRCDRTPTPIAAVPVDVAGSQSWSFTVPAGCPAQWFELAGVSSDVARESEVTISNLRLAPERTHG